MKFPAPKLNQEKGYKILMNRLLKAGEENAEVNIVVVGVFQRRVEVSMPQRGKLPCAVWKLSRKHFLPSIQMFELLIQCFVRQRMANVARSCERLVEREKSARNDLFSQFL